VSEFLAGWSKLSMVPPARYGMAGYLAREKPSAGFLDSLYVRALVLRHGSTTAAILLADILLVSTRRAGPLRRRLAKALKTHPDYVTVAATHTHSGPLVDTAPFNFSRTPNDARMKKFHRQLERLFLKAAHSAARHLQPVSVTVSKAPIRNVASDRNRPHSERTQPFLLFHFRGVQGTAILGIYGCHPTVLGAANCLFSGDLHGRIASQLERDVDVALVANGAAGNISTRFTRRNQNPAELARLVSLVTRQTKKAPALPLAIDCLAARSLILRLPLRIFRPSSPPSPSPRRKGRLLTVGGEARIVQRQLRQSKIFAGKSVFVLIFALRIGPITLACLPFEIFSSTGRFLWTKAKTFPLCYANGYWGYLPDSSAKSGDYEVISSAFPVKAEAKLRRALLALTKSLAH
jgi:Neutral/alkaline non-lysosomal ceramidase, N-terminal